MAPTLRTSLSAVLALVGGVAVVASISSAVPAQQPGGQLARVGHMAVGTPAVAATRIDADAQSGVIRFYAKGAEVAMLDEFGLHVPAQPVAD